MTVQMASTSQTQFQTQKYLKIPSLVEGPLLQMAYRYTLMKLRSGQLNQGDRQVPDSHGAYADPFMEALLQTVQPNLEQIIGISLFPTYSYFRIYKKGNELTRHLDRPSCEISVTLTLGRKAQSIWPIFIENDQGVVAVDLEAGDGLVYRGCDLPHWREAFVGEQQVQVFLHYVDREGPCAAWRYDQRLNLGFPTKARPIDWFKASQLFHS